MEALDTVVESIERRRGNTTLALLVAIDGHSAAGKSTLAGELAARLDAALVHADDFYRDLTHDDRLALSPEQGVSSFFDWERMRREALEPLRAHNQARFRRFDWSVGSGLTSDLVVVGARPIVIVEGVYSARPEFDDLLDLKVLVEAPLTERERRRRERHDLHLWEERWDASEQHYFRFVRPADTFDVTVTGHA